MTDAPRPPPLLSFRNIPPAIYIALAFNVAGALAITIAAMFTSGELWERYRALDRWFTLDAGCDAVFSILLGLGLLELARRHTGGRRSLAMAAAWLSFASLAWLAFRPLNALLESDHETWVLVHTWLGRGVGVATLAGVVMLAIAADAWRRAPISAALLVVLGLTGYWVPLLGEEIAKLLGSDPVPRQLYGLVRLGVNVPALLFVVAALAADGRDPAPEPRAAASGLRLARGILVFRMVAGIVVAMALVGIRSRDLEKLVMYGGPAVATLTMVLFAIALQRVASARIEGMPRLPLSLAAAITVWWAGVQLVHFSALINAKQSSLGSEPLLQTMQTFPVLGPIVATLGLALVGTALASFASHRGDLALRRVVTGHTVAFLVATLAGIGVQSQIAKATSAGSAGMMLVFASFAALVGFAVLAGLLLRAAAAVEAEPEVPPARVV